MDTVLKIDKHLQPNGDNRNANQCEEITEINSENRRGLGHKQLSTGGKRRRKRRERRLPPEGGEKNEGFDNGVAIHLKELKEDVEIIQIPSKIRHEFNEFVVGAEKIPLPKINGDGKLVSSQFLYSQLAPNIYIEHRTGFHTEPVGQFERFRSSEKEAAIGATAELRILDHTDGSIIPWNPGLNFAFTVHKALTLILTALLGLLAGAALVHTLFVQILAAPFINGQVTSDSGYLFITTYGRFANGVASTYYICLVFTGLTVFDRVDPASPSRKCFLQCAKFQNAGLASFFSMAALAVNSAMYYLDALIYSLSQVPENNLRTVLTEKAGMDRALLAWRALDATRTVLLLVIWLLVSLGGRSSNRLMDNLHFDPSRQEPGPDGTPPSVIQ